MPESHTPAPGAEMIAIDNLADMVEVAEESTVSRTVLKAEGTRLVLFAFDTGQVLTEHTAAMPVVITAVSGHLKVGGSGRVVDLKPGGVIHLPARLPHTVEAVEPSVMSLLMVDSRQK